MIEYHSVLQGLTHSELRRALLLENPLETHIPYPVYRSVQSSSCVYTCTHCEPLRLNVGLVVL
jgi:hypothetical protein